MKVGTGYYIRIGGLIVSPLLLFLALPGHFGWWLMLPVCLVPLFLWLASSESPRQALRRGILSGIVLYCLQLYWIVPVLHTFGGLPFALAIPSLVLLTIYMGLYLGCFAYAFFCLSGQSSFLLLFFGAPALWVGLDWLRSWMFSGFPWLDLGYGVWSVSGLVQAADLLGHYGYTFMIVLLNVLLFAVAAGRFPRGKILTGAVLCVLLTVCAFLYSKYRSIEFHDILRRAPHAVVGIVQGNVAQGEKWSPQRRLQTVETYIRQSAELISQIPRPELIVWPETALPFYPKDSRLFTPVRTFVYEHKVDVLTGAPWYEVIDWEKRQFQYFNAALLIGDDARINGRYYKSHLVPYGEYVPLKKYMPFLAPLVEAAGDFTPGKIETPLVSGKIKAGLLICYESIFEKIGRVWVKNGANLLVNLTNDAWYGKSSAPHQSWAMSVFRAVETRRSLVRSANTGISGAVDPLGQIKSESGLFVSWAATVDVALVDVETFFVRGGFLFGPFCACFGLLAFLHVKLGPGRRKK